jgi:hypothetical protein
MEVVCVTRRNYRQIAESIRELKETSIFPMDWEMIANKLAVALEKENPRFDRQKFLDYIRK